MDREGVDVNLFLAAGEDPTRSLSQSYRLPVSVHSLSQSIVKRIHRKTRQILFSNGTRRVLLTFTWT